MKLFHVHRRNSGADWDEVVSVIWCASTIEEVTYGISKYYEECWADFTTIDDMVVIEIGTAKEGMLQGLVLADVNQG